MFGVGFLFQALWCIASRGIANDTWYYPCYKGFISLKIQLHLGRRCFPFFLLISHEWTASSAGSSITYIKFTCTNALCASCWDRLHFLLNKLMISFTNVLTQSTFNTSQKSDTLPISNLKTLSPNYRFGADFLIYLSLLYRGCHLNIEQLNFNLIHGLFFTFMSPLRVQVFNRGFGPLSSFSRSSTSSIYHCSLHWQLSPETDFRPIGPTDRLPQASSLADGLSWKPKLCVFTFYCSTRLTKWSLLDWSTPFVGADVEYPLRGRDAVVSLVVLWKRRRPHPRSLFGRRWHHACWRSSCVKPLW